jgi:hypothetical protein
VDPRAQEILDNATNIQQDYVVARLTHPNSSAAARALGLNRSSPHNWDNLEELEEAVAILRRDAVEAAQLVLAELMIKAVAALGEALKDKSHRVAAARAILDRGGLPAQANVDVTSGGEPIKVQFTWHDPDSNAQTAQPDPEADDHL